MGENQVKSLLLGGLRTLDSILGAAATTLFDAGRVKSATNNMVTDTRQVLHTTTANEDDRVLLQIMTFVRDV